MKIAIISDTFLPQVNGVVNSVYHLANSLSESGHSVLVLSVSAGTDSQSNERSLFEVIGTPSIKTAIYPDQPVTLPVGIVFRRLKQFKPDIIHVHTPFALGWEGIIAGKLLKVPVVGTHHTFFDHYLKHVKLDFEIMKKFTWKYTKGFYNFCSAVVSPTNSLADELIKNGLKKEISVIPNGIDTNFFVPVADSDLKKKFKKEMGFDGKAIIYEGRLSYEKSIGDLIMVMSLLKEKMPNLKLLLVGDGPERKNLEDLAKKLRVADNVIFTGFIFGEKLLKTFQASDIFVTGSRSENMPLSILEGMSAGLPVIAPSSLGLKEMILDGKNGYLTLPGDLKELSDKIYGLLKNPRFLKSMSEKSRQRALDFSRLTNAKKHLEVYEKLIK